MWSLKAHCCQNKEPWKGISPTKHGSQGWWRFHLSSKVTILRLCFQMSTMGEVGSAVHQAPELDVSAQMIYRCEFFKKPELTQRDAGPNLNRSGRAKPRIAQDCSNSSSFANARDNPRKALPKPLLPSSLGCKGRHTHCAVCSPSSSALHYSMQAFLVRRMPAAHAA